MDGHDDEYCLESIVHQHGIAAAPFIPFVIERLAAGGGVVEALIAVTLQGISGWKDGKRRLRLWWSPASASPLPLGLQENTLTEWAALGIMCAVVHLYGDLRVKDVARVGERCDYWVVDGERDFGLEVSGTMTDEVEVRRREKVRQLRANPDIFDGYVVVVGFATREVLFSYHRFAEDVG